ncbi:MAG: hypothetical protein QXH24_01130 [Candidatus Bathyarchaeia archaeon]
MLDLLAQMLQNPTTFIIIAIELILGFCLGYLSIKVLKYILALIVILVAGVLLNIWSLGISLETLVSRFGEYAIVVKELFVGLAGTLGLLTLGPVTVGFIIGIVAAAIKGK